MLSVSQPFLQIRLLLKLILGADKHKYISTDAELLQYGKVIFGLPDSYFCGTVPLEPGLNLCGPASLESFQSDSGTSCLILHNGIEEDAGGWANPMPSSNSYG